MELSELIDYAKEKYQIEEQHKWAGFPGFSVLCHPRTGKWAALLMRQWDTETGTEIERCDLKCGIESLMEYNVPYLSPPIRMKGRKWVGVKLNESADRDVVCALFDRAMESDERRGYTVVLDAAPIPAAYRDTALPRPAGLDRAAAEPVPKRIREMRACYDYASTSFQNKSRNFYRQGMLMADYEDDCPWRGEFICYFPTYHDLNTRQLRGYFTWRTQVRKGNYQPTSASFAYLYLYELLNGIGTASPEDSLRRMKAFESGYLGAGFGDTRMRKYLRRWMLDFAVVHELPPETARRYADSELLRRDEALAVLRTPEDRTDEDVFSALCDLGDAKLAASSVLARDAGRGKHLFAEIYRYSLAHYRLERGNLFTLFFGERGVYHWDPFSNAVYWAHERHGDCDYVLSECRRYFCRDGFWQVEKFESVYFNKEKLRGFLHLADLKLRRYLQTGHSLRERSGEAWAAPYIDAAIEADKKAAMEAARPKVTINFSDLEQIRADAAVTRESLLTEDERDEPEALAVTSAEDKASERSPDTIQLQIVRALLRGEEVAGLLRANHLMPSMAADRINEALLDDIGDTVVSCEDDRLTLVEDYREDLAQLLGGTSHGGT